MVSIQVSPDDCYGRACSRCRTFQPRRRVRSQKNVSSGAAATTAASCCALVLWANAANLSEVGHTKNEHDDCWTYGGIRDANPDFGPEACCTNAPCGVKLCFAPPEFTYDFCCQKDGCRPGVVSNIQIALSIATESPSPGLNASLLAFRSAPEAFRTMLRGSLRDIRLFLLHGLQDCVCALAYAAAVLVQPNGPQSKLAETSIGLNWFVRGIDWSTAVELGWGGIFVLLSWPPQPQHPSKQSVLAQPSAAVANAAASVAAATAAFAWRRHGQHACGNGSGIPLQEFMQVAQKGANTVLEICEAEGGMSFPTFVYTLRIAGFWTTVSQQIFFDIRERRQGRKCTAVQAHGGIGKWVNCTPWEYSKNADFTSPSPFAGAATVQTRSAVCVLGAPRNLVETYSRLRTNVVEVVRGNVFVYVPFADMMTPALEVQLELIGPVITAIAARDVDADGFERRFYAELQNRTLDSLYVHAPGPWRAPLYRQMGSSMWGYFHQHCCKRMVEAHEAQIGRHYEWVIFARADLYWVHQHPPLEIMDPKFVYIPFGQDNSFYAYGSEYGINDRHAVVPRSLMEGYFGRWESLCTGAAWRYMEGVAKAGFQFNTEQYLLLHLLANHVPVRRFPPVAFVVICSEGPQCQHLYKGTTLRRQQWTFTAKYWSELIEVRRTLHDQETNRKLTYWNWIWAPLRPHAPIGPQNNKHWEYHGIEFVCCLSRSGPVSCYMWYLFRQCRSLA